MAMLWGLLLWQGLITVSVLQIHSSLHDALQQVLKGIQSGEGADVVLTVFGDQVGVHPFWCGTLLRHASIHKRSRPGHGPAWLLGSLPCA
jgi:hypothetical protein